MKVNFHISHSSKKQFVRACEAAIINVGSGTKMAVTEAAQEIMLESMNQVPRDTGTLASTAYVGVSRRVDVKNYRYGAILGYGRYGGVASLSGLGDIEWMWPPNNKRNPKNGLYASVYATMVHENLMVKHKTGKAKFLEDPIRAWAAGRFERTVAEYWRTAIQRTSVTSLTSMSNRQINKLIERGKIDAKLPDKPELLDVKGSIIERATTRQGAAKWVKDMEAFNTAQNAIRNPSRKRHAEHSKNLKYIRQVVETHTSTKAKSITIRRKKR